MEGNLWFYRPPLKVTAHINFKTLFKDAGASVQRACSLADSSRRDLLTALGTDPDKFDPESNGLNKHLDVYLSLLIGAMQHEANIPGGFPSSWTDSLAGTKQKSEQKDVSFDYCHILVNCAFWLAKRAAYAVRRTGCTASQMEANMKEAYQLLKTAAGMISHVQSSISKLKAKPEPFSDLEVKILSAYENQFLAEAQEIALQRAIEAKQAPDVICPLAADTSRRYEEISKSLTGGQAGKSTIPAPSRDLTDKFRTYADLKKMYWQAVSRSYQIEILLASNQAGQALRCVDDAKLQNESFSNLASKNKGAFGIPNEAFFAVSKLVEKTADKCHRENTLLHHQKAAAEVPALCTNAQFGLATSANFNPPAPHALWSEVVPVTPGGSNTGNSQQSSSSSCSLM